MGRLTQKKDGNRLILVMADRFRNLTKVLSLERTTVLYFEKAFESHLDFKYGAPKESLSENCIQGVSKRYKNT